MDLRTSGPAGEEPPSEDELDAEIAFEDVTGLVEPDLAEGRADIAAGRVVPNSKVVEWIRSWGTANELPMPSSWPK